MTLTNRHGCFLAVLTCSLLGALFASAEAADELDPAADKLRQFALSHDGDATAGENLFKSHRELACAACHRISGMERSGPNLDGIGDKYSRAELIDHILRPNQVIKPGFEQAIVVTKQGKVLNGRIERATKIEVRIIDGTGKQFNLKRRDIDELSYAAESLMPMNAAATLSPPQFADLIAYLQSLTFGTKEGFIAGNMPYAIERLEKPVSFRPLFGSDQPFLSPVWCGPLPGSNVDLIVIEHQEARAWRVARSESKTERELFLDLGDEAYVSPNQGLMCIAFHPNYAENGRYFVEYEIEQGTTVKTIVAERQAAPDRMQDSGQPSLHLLEVEQPAFNHNGGCIEFGPDGMLYAAFGDGGPQRDPPGHAQNLRQLLGSMVRIDVDNRPPGRPYAIPGDNPFLLAHQQDSAIRPEIWAYGFREPWRFSFDSVTGDLWLGDVGQDKFEEVCLVRRGDNHGWNVYEGFAPFSEEYRRSDASYTEPVFAYPHGLGFSVTGGYAYRGTKSPSFEGVYIFGDFNTRRVWGLRKNENSRVDVYEIGTAPGGIASFGLDHDGEVLLVTYGGVIYHVDLSDAHFP